MEPLAADDLLLAGAVVGVHGLRGDLKVRPLSGDDSSLDTVDVLHLGRPGSPPVAHRVLTASRHKGNILFRLDGCSSAEAAQTLVGSQVFLSRSRLAQLPDDEYYWFELEGLEVIDRRHGALGRLEEVFTTPAHDIYVVRGRYGEVLIPAVDAFIVQVDEEQRTMLVDLPEGLVPESADDAV